MSLEDAIPPRHQAFQLQWAEDKIGLNASDCQLSFKQFRKTIRPNMKWNWMVENVTDELQEFSSITHS
jgi:hypothetical protein